MIVRILARISLVVCVVIVIIIVLGFISGQLWIDCHNRYLVVDQYGHATGAFRRGPDSDTITQYQCFINSPFYHWPK